VVKVDAKTRKILDDYLTERIKKTNSTSAAAPAAAAAVPVPGAEKKEGEAEVGLSGKWK
jgi:ribosomal protein L12E/L44/L45/RPP1/RPP2